MTPIQPRNGYIHIQLNVPKDNLVLLPESAGVQIRGSGDEASTYIQVLAVSPGEITCKPGDFLLLRPDCNFMPYSSDPKTALIAAQNVLGVYGEPAKEHLPSNN